MNGGTFWSDVTTWKLYGLETLRAAGYVNQVVTIVDQEAGAGGWQKGASLSALVRVSELGG